MKTKAKTKKVKCQFCGLKGISFLTWKGRVDSCARANCLEKFVKLIC